MVLEESTIETILNSKLGSDFEVSIRDYLVQLLLEHSSNVSSVSGSSNEEFENALVETVAPFLEDNVPLARQIVAALVTAIRTSKTAPSHHLLDERKDDAMEIVVARSFSDKNATVSLENENPCDAAPPKRSTTQRPTKDKKRPPRKETLEDRKLKDADEEDCPNDEEMTVGGRGRGGRGAYAGKTNSIHGNIHLYNVSLSLSNGIDLLSPNTSMDILKGHRYGLIGRNGVGKSTLLRRLAQHALPGLPRDMRILLVEQQQTDYSSAASNNVMESLNGSEPLISAVEALVRSDADRTRLLDEQSRIELALEECDDNAPSMLAERVTEAMERLSVIATDLDAIQADTAYERAMEILQGLQFTETMILGPVANLSGGWRMRLALARALFVSSYDLICLDEATNHLDLAGLDWLIHYINHSSMTMVLVSHDRMFLDAVCTDIIVMEHQTLTYHVGNYSMYEQQQLEKSTREAQILDAAERQRSKAMAFVQKQQASANKKSSDPNKQRQAKMIRDKKMDRIGNYREDGKRYKLRSLKTLDEKSVRLAQQVQIEVDEPIIQMHFPNPVWPPSIGTIDSIVRMEDLSFFYNECHNESNPKLLLRNVTLNIQRESKIALVGSNGCGKSSLVKLIAGEHTNATTTTRGNFWIHPNVRVGHVSQYTVEELEQYANLTVIDYAEQHLVNGRVAADIAAKASGNIRQYLGAFGLGGKHALQRIGKLSGGERMRLCFATVLADNPGLLLLDESTNHCDITLLEAMAVALNNFKGAVVMVSHNQSFLSCFCNELWVLDDGHITVTHSDTKSFDDIFMQYRCSISQKDGGLSLNDRRKNKASLAKRATKQRAGIQQDTALL